MSLVKSSKGQIWRDDNLLPETKTIKTKTLKDGSKVKEEASFVRSKKTGGEGVFYEKKRVVFADSGSEESDEEYQEIPLASPGQEGEENDEEEDQMDSEDDQKVALDSALSDMDYLRSKMVPKETLDDKVADQSEEEEDEEELDEDEEEEVDIVEEKETKEEADEPVPTENPSDAKKSLFEGDDQDLADQDENVGETGRLFIRNLPFSTTEEEIVKHFGKWGELAEVHLPVDSETKQGKGYAFVQFMNPAEALVAFEHMDNTIFQGRLLHLIPAKNLTSIQADAKTSSDARSSFKRKKETKTKDIAGDDTNWSTIFLRSDTVASAIADTLQVKKTDLFNPEADNMAVRMALAEAQIIQQTKDALEEVRRH